MLAFEYGRAPARRNPVRSLRKRPRRRTVAQGVEPREQRHPHQVREALRAHLRHDVAPVHLDGARADAQVARFHERHPDTAVRLETDALRSRLERLLDDKADLVLGTRDPYPEDRLAYRAVVAPEGTYSRRFGEDAAETLGIAVNVVVEVGGGACSSATSRPDSDSPSCRASC